MTEANFSVVFDGTVVEGTSREQVIARLAEAFKQPPEKIAPLFRRRNVVVKRGVTRDVAERYRKAFRKAGAICRIRAARQDRTEPEAVPAKRRDPAPALDVERIATLFNGKVSAVPVTAGYRAGLVGVAVAMLILPLIYLALTAAAAYATYWWAGNGWELLPTDNYKARVVLYPAPLVIGSILFLFMLKPLFARFDADREPLMLNRRKEPLFFAFVEQICDRVGAPRPKFIQVDCHVNAAAGFYRGWLGLRRNELALTIGMPVMAGMSTRQLAGVLAHEFGHFAQGAGLRATFLIRTINYWLYRAVYHRDIWDYKLERYSAESENLLVMVTLLIARGAVGTVRLLLSILTALADLISHYMLRQMEYDADRYEAQIAGSAHFKNTSLRLRLLSYAFQANHAELALLWEDRKLVDDVPAMVVAKAAELEAEFNERVDEILAVEESGVFDTHPADADRIENAQKLDAPGVFELELPARVLLRNFDELAKLSTRRFYITDLGIKPSDEQLVGADQMRATVAAAHDQVDALSAYCRDLFLSQRFVRPHSPAEFAGLTAEQRKRALDDCVAELRRAGPEIHRLAQSYQHADTDLTAAYVVHVVSAGGMPPEYAPEVAPDKTDYALMGERLDEIRKAIARHEQVLEKRLAIGLAGLLSDGTRTAEHAEIERLLSVRSGLAGMQEDYDAIYRYAILIQHLIQVALATQNADAEFGVVPEQLLQDQLRALEEARERIASRLQKVPYPFERAGEQTDLYTHLSEDLPPTESDNLIETAGYVMALMPTIARLHARVVGQLAQLAGGYETELGVEPIQIVLAKQAAAAC